MGVVYRAKDTKLERTTALKFLPADLTYDTDAKERFIREAQAASALDHPNICTIYEIDETSDGHMFICMPFYDGETVKKKIARGPLAVNEAIDIAFGVARGLIKAHSQGIVHRDIKPANIMVSSDGVVKIVDFGLAKLGEVAGITETGMRIGTPAYMSPEQARGEEVDHRSDIWSLGVVLYEMISGQVPFKGDYEETIIYLVLHEDPKPLTDFRRNVPSTFNQIIAKALKKDKSKRYQNVQEMIDALKIASSQKMPAPEPKTAIAVLPFDDISPDKGNEYFSDGLTEEIIAHLSKLRSLSVISRTSVMRLKGKKMNVKTIGHELNVQYLLEGSVRKLGEDLRITAQLIDVEGDSHVWAQKYDGELEDVFDMQERVSRSIVDALKLKLSPEEERQITERPIDNVHAYESYLRARQEIMLFTEEGLKRALQHLQRAMDIVGENAFLYAGIGYVYWSYVNLGIKAPEEYLPKAEAYVEKVFKLDPESSRGHMLQGVINITRGNPKEVVKHLKRTLASDPNDPDALFWLLLTCASAGRTSIAMQYAEKLLEVDPLTPINHATPGYALICDGRFDLALEKEKKWYELEPDTAISKFWYGWILAHNGRFEEAFTLFDKSKREAPDDLWTKLGLCFKYALQGDTNGLASMTQELAAIAKWDLQYSLFLAECHALAGHKEEALHWLEISADRGFINYPLISKSDPFLENIRGEDQFEELVEKIKYNWERFEV